jgi:hypothetical protein
MKIHDNVATANSPRTGLTCLIHSTLQKIRYGPGKHPGYNHIEAGDSEWAARVRQHESGYCCLCHPTSVTGTGEAETLNVGTRLGPDGRRESARC